MPRTNPATGNTRKPKAMPTPPTSVVPVAPSKPVGTRNRSNQGDATLQQLTGLALPDKLQAKLPQFDQLLQVADVGTPTAFDAAGWQRVTDDQRKQDERHYRELKNYAKNVGDGIGVLNEMALAAVVATELGKTLIRYATGVEGMRTEAVKFQVQQVETAIVGEKLVGKQNDLQHQNELNQVNLTRDQQLIQFRTRQNGIQAQQYQAELEGLNQKLDGQRRKNEADLIDIQNRYPALR